MPAGNSCIPCTIKEYKITIVKAVDSILLHIKYAVYTLTFYHMLLGVGKLVFLQVLTFFITLSSYNL